MDRYVIDTSVAFKALFIQGNRQEEGREKALNLFDSAEIGKIKLLAPSLIWYELNNCFIVNGVPVEQTVYKMDVFRQQIDNGLVEIFPPSKELLEKSIELANINTRGQGYISSYDATFHALAILEGATFLTADKKHVRKTEKLIGSVKLFE